MKLQLAIDLAAEQQRLGVVTLILSGQPALILRRVYDHGHAGVEMLDLPHGRRGDNRALVTLSFSLCAQMPAKLKPSPPFLCSSHGSFLPSSALTVHSK